MMVNSVFSVTFEPRKGPLLPALVAVAATGARLCERTHGGGAGSLTSGGSTCGGGGAGRNRFACSGGNGGGIGFSFACGGGCGAAAEASAAAQAPQGEALNSPSSAVAVLASLALEYLTCCSSSSYAVPFGLCGRAASTRGRLGRLSSPAGGLKQQRDHPSARRLGWLGERLFMRLGSYLDDRAGSS